MFIAVVTYFLLFVEVLCCLLLIGVILLQRSRSQGAGLAFGAGMGETLFGAQAGNVLTKTTVILAAVFLLNTTFLAYLQTRRGGAKRSVADRIEPLPAPAPPRAPPQPAPLPAPGGPVAGEGEVAWPAAEDLGGAGLIEAQPAPAAGEEAAPGAADAPPAADAPAPADETAPTTSQ